MLEIKDLHKSFGKKEVLHGISLNANDGEITGFIGHNGAGKTTTLKIVAGILEPSSGEVFVNKMSMKQEPVECKKIMAYLPDNPDLYDYLKGIEYLNFIADIYEVNKEDRLNRIESLAKELEIYDVLGDEIRSYSHGMKQKVAVISAFLHEPKLLLLDEPFVGLDPKASFILKNKMKELCSKGSSILFSSHVLEVVENLCDSIAIIKEGNLVKQSKTEDILKTGQTLEDLFLELEK